MQNSIKAKETGALVTSNQALIKSNLMQAMTSNYHGKGKAVPPPEDYMTASSLKKLMKEHENTIKDFMLAINDSESSLRRMTEQMTNQANELDNLRDKNAQLQQTVQDMATAAATSVHAKSTGGSVLSAQSTTRTWADVCRQLPPSPTTLPSATVALIDSILDRTMIQSHQPIQPAEQVEFYRNLSQIEIEHRVALLYIVGIKDNTTYSHLKQQLTGLGFPMQEVFNISKISKAATEFIVNATFAGFLAKKFREIGFKVLESFKMNKPSSTPAQLAWNARRLQTMKDQSPRQQVKKYAESALAAMVCEHPEMDLINHGKNNQQTPAAPRKSNLKRRASTENNLAQPRITSPSPSSPEYTCLGGSRPPDQVDPACPQNSNTNDTDNPPKASTLANHSTSSASSSQFSSVSPTSSVVSILPSTVPPSKFQPFDPTHIQSFNYYVQPKELPVLQNYSPIFSQLRVLPAQHSPQEILDDMYSQLVFQLRDLARAMYKVKPASASQPTRPPNVPPRQNSTQSAAASLRQAKFASANPAKNLPFMPTREFLDHARSTFRNLYRSADPQYTPPAHPFSSVPPPVFPADFDFAPESTIHDIISASPLHKSPGPDGISINLLKQLALTTDL
ncbi:hypothetical protein HDU80_000432, partial [Chytriomyces hyalinus]